MSCKIILYILLISIVSLSLAHNDYYSDVIVEWNEFYYNHSTTFLGFFVEPREVAMLNLACHDAINSIKRVYNLYGYGVLPSPATANLDAAICEVFFVLTGRFIDNRLNHNSSALYLSSSERLAFHNDLNAAYDQIMGRIPNGNAKDDGIIVGEIAADDMWRARSHDGWNNSVTYEAPQDPEPGEWFSLTGVAPIYYHLKDVILFTKQEASFFRCPPPPAVTDRVFMEDLEITRVYGALDSPIRNAAQSYSASWWAQVPGYAVGYQILIRLLKGNNNYTLHDKTRIFAYLGMSVADDLVVNIESKAHWNFWRPEHAIHFGGQDVNPDIVVNTSWVPFHASVNNQDYPAGHPMHTSTGVQALRNFFGDLFFAGGIILQNTPRLNQTFYSLSDIEYSVAMARVFSGIHLLHSGLVGSAHGRKITDFSMSHFLL